MYYYKLKKKSIICIEGKDTTSFLQGIITNNINKLKPIVQFILLYYHRKVNYYMISFYLKIWEKFI